MQDSQGIGSVLGRAEGHHGRGSVADEADLVVRFGVSLGWEGGGSGHRQLQDEAGVEVVGIEIFLCYSSLWEPHEAWDLFPMV